MGPLMGLLMGLVMGPFMDPVMGPIMGQVIGPRHETSYGRSPAPPEKSEQVCKQCFQL